MITRDRLLGGRVEIAQPEGGYRAAIDPVLLAAGVPARPGEAVLDLGCGGGAAGLCLLARRPDCAVSGLEVQRDMAALARLGRAGDRAMTVVAGDLRAPPPEIAETRFHHVMMNPPHGAEGRGTPPPDPGKARAHVAGATDLPAWMAAAHRFLMPKGTLTLIHRADRLVDVLTAMSGRFGDIAVFPLWPKAGMPAKRILARGRKGRRTPPRLLPGLVLHDDNGAFTPAAEAVLRDGAALDLG